MKSLLVDIGNTTADFRIYDSELKTLTKIIRPETREKEWRRSNVLSKYFFENNISFSNIAYVSVVPEWNDILRAFANNMNVKLFNLRSDFNIDKNIFHVDDINRLGADFISNFYGYLDVYAIENGAIISMGTASTIAVIKNSKFEGAIICPGLQKSLNCLISSAALLQNNHYEKSTKNFGTNTVDAINVGAFNAHYLMLSSMVKKLGFDFAVFTGGNSNYFVDEIEEDKFIFDEELIFKGLIKFIKEH